MQKLFWLCSCIVEDRSKNKILLISMQLLKIISQTLFREYYTHSNWCRFCFTRLLEVRRHVVRKWSSVPRGTSNRSKALFTRGPASWLNFLVSQVSLQRTLHRVPFSIALYMGCHGVRHVSLAVTFQTASYAARETLSYVRQEISCRGH